MPIRYRIGLLVLIPSVLLFTPSLSSAQTTLPMEGATVTPADSLPDSPAPEPGNDAAQAAIKEGFLSSVWRSITDEAHVTLGYGRFEVKLDFLRRSDGATATMVQQDKSSVTVQYGSRPSFFKDANFGYTFMFNYVGFNMGEQEVYNDTSVNLGTNIHGQIFYFVPTLFYQWGEHRYRGRFIRLGFGAGLGTATYSGTVQLSGSQIPNERIYTINNSYTPRLALSNFLEARWNHFGVSISYASPRIYGDEYDIKVSNFTAYLGYSLYF